MTRLTWCSLAALLACSGGRPAERAGTTPGATTRYRAGDWVEYRYTGSFTAQPVQLREDVVAQEGNRLTIDVTVVRGAERRRWRQVLTDTPENQRSEKIDALYDLNGDAPVLLANEANTDLYAFYAWTLPQPPGRPTHVSKATEQAEVGGRPLECMVERGEFDGGVPFSFATCEAFLWTNGAARIGADHAPLWQRDVIAYGPFR